MFIDWIATSLTWRRIGTHYSIPGWANRCCVMFRMAERTKTSACTPCNWIWHRWVRHCHQRLLTTQLHRRCITKPIKTKLTIISKELLLQRPQTKTCWCIAQGKAEGSDVITLGNMSCQKMGALDPLPLPRVHCILWSKNFTVLRSAFCTMKTCL